MSRYEHAMRQWRSGVESRRRVESCIGAHGSALHMPDFALLLLQIIYSQLWTSDLPAIFIFAESCAKCFFLKKRRVERQKPGRVICSMGQARFRVFRQSDNMFGCLVCVRSSTHQSIIAGPAYEQEQPPKKKKKKQEQPRKGNGASVGAAYCSSGSHSRILLCCCCLACWLSLAVTNHVQSK